jgi:hypothetical protein
MNDATGLPGGDSRFGVEGRLPAEVFILLIILLIFLSLFETPIPNYSRQIPVFYSLGFQPEQFLKDQAGSLIYKSLPGIRHVYETEHQ